LFFPIESSHGGLPCGHVAAPSEPASKLVTIPLDPTERDPVHLGWSVVVEADGLGDGGVVYAAHLPQELPDRILIPALRIGVALDPLVVGVSVAPPDRRGRRHERLTRRGGMAIATCVAIEEPPTARAAETQRVVALDDPSWSSRPAQFAHRLHLGPEGRRDHRSQACRLTGAETAGVDRVRGKFADVGLGQASGGCDLPVCLACGGEFVRATNRRCGRLIDPQRRRLALADDAVWRSVAAGYPESTALRGVAFTDALGELAAVRLGLMGLADELVPVVRVRAEQTLAREQDHHAGRVKMIFNGDERLLEVAKGNG
jgi:hypothetical protein